MKVEKVLSLKSKAEIKLNNLKNDLLRQQKEGISGFVVSLLLILAAIVVGAVYMKLANKGMETIFQDMINRIINGFKLKILQKRKKEVSQYGRYLRLFCLRRLFIHS